jgi:hypothetical protein
VQNSQPVMWKSRLFGAKPPILYESSLSAMAYRYVFGIVVVLSREALFPGLPLAKSKHFSRTCEVRSGITDEANRLLGHF